MSENRVAQLDGEINTITEKIHKETETERIETDCLSKLDYVFECQCRRVIESRERIIELERSATILYASKVVEELPLGSLVERHIRLRELLAVRGINPTYVHPTEISRVLQGGNKQ